MKGTSVWMRRPHWALGLLLLLSVPAIPFTVSAQTVSKRSLITEAVDENRLTLLRGNTYPLARPEFDRGAAPLDLPMRRMLLVLKRSPEQEAALATLLDQQQDKSSPNFHHWLTPQEFGQQFGPSDEDIQTVTNWLHSRGFQVNKVSNGRMVIEFSGTAGRVREGFHTEIHKYIVEGAEHWANSADPQLPTALTPVIAGIDTLHNFPRKPLHHVVGRFTKSRSTGAIQPLESLFSFSGTCSATGVTTCYGLGPYDFAAIYDVTALWNANPAIDGSGQSIAIVGESNINVQDVRAFRNLFGLPPNDPQIILDGPDPGIVPGDETESDLDVEWAGGVAKGATIKFVTSATTDSTLGVDLSAQYIVDHNISPIMSVSYGICEPALGTSGNQFFNQLWQQAAAQGISVFVATGDSGSAVCDRFGEPAQFGLEVSGFSSTPYNVGVGGTDFNDVLTQPTFWNNSNDPHFASAKGYIPETTWNDSCTNGQLTRFGFSADPEINCNNHQLVGIALPNGGSGGKSSCTVGDGQDVTSCSGGYAKPAWQTALTPADGKRDLPDVSFYAATGLFTASFYIVCEADQTNGIPCDQNPQALQFIGVGGTSASAPSFAGIMALVDQKTNSSQGNANYVLYPLAGQVGASCASTAAPPAGCIFHDVTAGTIAMACFTGSKDCTTSHAGDPVGILNGYPAKAGYDLATGLGSVDAANLVNAYGSFVGSLEKSATTLALTPSPVNVVHGANVNVNISVAPNPPAKGTPTGIVSLLTSNGQSVEGLALDSSGNFSGTTNLLPGGSYTVTAHYPGDGVFGASDSSPTGTVTVSAEPSHTSVSILSGNLFLLPGPFTSGPYGVPVFLRADVAGQSGNGIPTGTINFTDTLAGVSSAVPGNPYTLNGGGNTFTPNGLFTFAPGQHSIVATYSGDASFQPSSNSSSPAIFTITPAATSVSAPTGNQSAELGTDEFLNVNFSTNSCGNSPTGTITLFDGATSLGDAFLSVSTNPNTCAISGSGTLVTRALLQGPNTITAKYNGDANYAPSPLSPPTIIDGVAPTTTTLVASQTTVQQGQTVTFTATVQPNQSAGPPLTGTVRFLGLGPGSNPIPLNNGQAQFSTSTNVVGPQGVNAFYSGDANYEVSQGSTVVTVTPGPDYGVAANPQTIIIQAPGQQGSTALTFTGMNGFSGTFNLSSASCSGLPSESSCSFSPSTVTLSNTTTTAMTTLMISTKAPSSTAPGAPRRPLGPSLAPVLLVMLLSLLLGLARHFGRKRPQVAFVTLLAVALLLSFAACGGGGGGGGGPQDPGTRVGVDPNVMVSFTAGGVAHSIQLTVNVE